MSSTSGTTTGNKSIFDLKAAPRSDDEILKTQVVVTKDKRGEVGFKAYTAHYAMATEALATTLQIPNHIAPAVVGEEKKTSLSTLYMSNLCLYSEKSMSVWSRWT